MALICRAGYCARMAAPLVLLTGCALAKPNRPVTAPAPPSLVATASLAPATHPATVTRLPSARSQAIVPAAHQTPAAPLPPIQDADGLFAGSGELSLEQFVAEVEARNPSLQAMEFAWRAAAQRYPQAVALDDPMFMTMVAPASFGSNQVESAYILNGAQKLPGFGKRAARGAAASAEATAARYDVHDARLQVAQAARLAYYEYYLVARTSELINENAGVMQELRDSARVKYENNQVTEQDVLQADVELTDTERRQIEVERMRRVAAARINTLLRRDPLAPLPPPPRKLTIAHEPPPIEDLQGLALAQRPDLGALAARVRAEEAAVNLALKQYNPDAEFFGRYDSFWQPAATQSDLRGQVGINVNVPIYRQKLQAAVCEAQFRLSQRRAEYRQRQLDIQYEIQAAYEQLQESRRTAQLYTDKFLPFAEQNVAVARANYDVGKTTFLALAQAQRQLIDVREKYQQTLADYHRRTADLERAAGGSLPIAAELLPRP